jgi:hypothetical protein
MHATDRQTLSPSLTPADELGGSPSGGAGGFFFRFFARVGRLAWRLCR